LRNEISNLVKKFPKEEKYRLVDQMLRASRSVTNNIAEGYGRFYYQENIQFCRQSRGSLYELMDHIIIALDEEIINRDTFKSTYDLIEKCIALLNGYINFLIKQKT
jgi:four helix bundle protein